MLMCVYILLSTLVSILLATSRSISILILNIGIDIDIDVDKLVVLVILKGCNDIAIDIAIDYCTLSFTLMLNVESAGDRGY